MSAADTPTLPSRDECLARLSVLRDEFVESHSRGRFHNAAALEWKAMPVRWRLMLMMAAGVGDAGGDVARMARRTWDEFSDDEQAELRGWVREGKRSLSAMSALAARM